MLLLMLAPEAPARLNDNMKAAAIHCSNQIGCCGHRHDAVHGAVKTHAHSVCRAFDYKMGADMTQAEGLIMVSQPTWRSAAIVSCCWRAAVSRAMRSACAAVASAA